MRQLAIIGTLGLFVLINACDSAGTASADNSSAPTKGSIAITVDGAGYHPGSVHAPAGKPVQLVFTRTSDEGCGQQLVFPTLNIRKDLLLNQPVTVNITMPASGSIAFTCGMNMYRGSIVAD